LFLKACFVLEDKPVGVLLRQITTQRVGPLSELPAVLREIGADIEAIFEGSGIDPAAITPDLRLPFPDLLNLLERAATISNCPHLGLLFGKRFDLVKHHGIIGELMHTAPTLKQAMVDCVTWQLGYSSGAIVYLNKLGNEYAFGYGTYEVSSRGTRVLYDVIVCIAIQMVYELSNGTVKPIEVHLAHDAESESAIYRKLLKLPVRFNQNRTCVWVEAAAMQIKPPQANPETRQRLLELIEETLWETKPDFVDKARHAIRQLMYYNGFKMPAVATELGLHPRTLRRRLAAEGETFEKLRDAVRYSVARELLELTNIPVGEISAFLYFASPGVFSKTFRRWSGTSPSSWRQHASTLWPPT
jgi:AraC-like DNA-binding protein